MEYVAPDEALLDAVIGGRGIEGLAFDREVEPER